MSDKTPLRVFVTSGYGYWGNFLPTDLELGQTQIGGGETAMIQTSRLLAERGHQVTVFYNVQRPGQYHGVDYLPIDMLVPMICQMEHDVLISWDNPSVFRFADRSKVHILAFQLNDAHVGAFDHTIEMYFHPSKWHADRFCKLYPEMSTTKVRSRITNGVDPKRYSESADKEKYRVIYSSSPDRGLHHLLRLWPLVTKEIPEAELHVYYDIKTWLKMDADMAENGLENITRDRADFIRNYLSKNEPGVIFHGGVGQAELAKEQLKSELLVYPCDPVQPTEGFSMTVLEAITAGCKVITSDADAFPELWADAPNVTILPLPVDDETWAKVIVEKLREDVVSKEAHQGILDLVHKKWSWRYLVGRMERELYQCLNSLQQPPVTEGGG